MENLTIFYAEALYFHASKAPVTLCLYLQYRTISHKNKFRPIRRIAAPADIHLKPAGFAGIVHLDVIEPQHGFFDREADLAALPGRQGYLLKSLQASDRSDHAG